MKESGLGWLIIGVLVLGGIIYGAHSKDEDQATDRSPYADSSDSESSSSSVLEFHGYPCTVDCSGHEAGYECAEEHDITDEDDENFRHSMGKWRSVQSCPSFFGSFAV